MGPARDKKSPKERNSAGAPQGWFQGREQPAAGSASFCLQGCPRKFLDVGGWLACRRAAPLMQLLCSAEPKPVLVIIDPLSSPGWSHSVLW